MADIEKVLQELPNISEMLYQMYKDETDKESISVRYYQYLVVDDAIELLKEQEQLKIALSEGQKQVQSLLSSGRELEETINILKGEIERLKVEKADIMRGIERKIAQANSILK